MYVGSGTRQRHETRTDTLDRNGTSAVTSSVDGNPASSNPSALFSAIRMQEGSLTPAVSLFQK